MRKLFAPLLELQRAIGQTFDTGIEALHETGGSLLLADEGAQRCLGGLATRNDRRRVGVELLLGSLGLARVVLARLPIATRLGNRGQHEFESKLEQLGRQQRCTFCSRGLERERTQAPLNLGLPGTRLDKVPFDAI